MDFVPTGPEGKFRSLDIYLFHYVNGVKNQITALDVPIPEIILGISFKGMVPMNFGEFKLDRSSDGNDETIKIEYTINKAEWRYNKSLFKGELVNKISDAKEGTEYGPYAVSEEVRSKITPDTANLSAWQPIFEGDTKNNEGARVGRQIVSTIPSEWSIT
jgi:hypothetical protein